MTTRRRFLSALASLAAAAGLSRYAPGAVAATERGVKPAGGPKGVPQPRQSFPVLPDPLAGRYVTVAFAMTDPTTGDSWLHHRIMRFDESDRLVEVSPEMYPQANG